jgi:hypothetical protein
MTKRSTLAFTVFMFLQSSGYHRRDASMEGSECLTIRFYGGEVIHVWYKYKNFPDP